MVRVRSGHVRVLIIGRGGAVVASRSSQASRPKVPFARTQRVEDARPHRSSVGPASGNDFLGAKCRKQVVKGLFGVLIDQEPELAAPAHVRHHLERPAQVEVGVPRRRDSPEIGFDKAYSLPQSPSRFWSSVRHLAFQRSRLLLETDPIARRTTRRCAATSSSTGNMSPLAIL